MLSDIRVVEIANWAAAPAAGALLAEQGADVIKIEPLGGDSMRNMMQVARVEHGAEIDHAYQFSNRGKRSLALALDTDEGAELARRLVDTADVCITNLLPARRQRFGLDVPDIRRRNPRCIVAVLTGYGTQGPDCDRPGYDITAFFAASGLSASILGADGLAPRWRAAQGDNVGGLALYAGIVTALLERETTGEGAVVETSLLQAAAWSNGFDLTRAAADGRAATARDRSGAVNPTAEAYRCRDGRMVQLALTEPNAGWAILCDVLPLDHLESDERFADVVGRFRHMDELIGALSAVIATVDSAWLLAEVERRGGAAALVATTAEAVVSEQFAAAGLLRPVEHPEHDDFDVIAAAFHVDGELPADQRLRPQPMSAFGRPGADSADVLEAALGLDPQEIEALRARGVVGVATDPD